MSLDTVVCHEASSACDAADRQEPLLMTSQPLLMTSAAVKHHFVLYASNNANSLPAMQRKLYR